MKTHLSEYSDEENCDDPIKLFDNDINAVYFGSQPHKPRPRDTKSHWTFETIGTNEFCQTSENSSLKRPDCDLKQTLQSGNISECHISQLCVKLVDCGKFPWYYRKYTQQIMHNLNLNEHSDDSDQDEDTEGIVDDSDDCFIVEDLQDSVTNKIIKNDQICINTVKSAEPSPKLPKNKLNKSLEIAKRLKEDMEIQRALSFKNVVKVDLKRNQGLVGMKITPKFETNTFTTLDVKTDKADEAHPELKSVTAEEKYLSAANKLLSHIGTQLIPITEDKESKSICQPNINNKESDLIGQPTLVKSSSFQNVPVKFDISKISEKLIDNLKTKKVNGESSDAKLSSPMSYKTPLNNPESTLRTVHKKDLKIINEKELSSKVTITDKLTNSSNTSHFNEIISKDKNDEVQIKNNASHSSLVGLLVTNKSKEAMKEIIKTKQKRNRNGAQNKATKLDNKKSRKKIEPKSPILHCSAIPKKLKKLQEPSKCNKTEKKSYLPKETCKLKEIVDKLTHINSCNFMQETTDRPKHVIPKITSVTKALDIHPKQASQKESCMIQDKTVSQVRNINAKPLNALGKLLNNCNEVSKADFKTNNFHNTQNMSSTQNKTFNDQNVLLNAHQLKVNKRTINAVSVTDSSHRAPIKSNKQTVSNNNVSTTAVVTPAGRSNAVLSKQNASFPTPHEPHFPANNTAPNKMSSSNIPNKNVPIQNRYASAIILKANNHTNFPFEKYCGHPPGQPPVQIRAFQSQPRSRDPHARYPTMYSSAPLGRHQSYFPTSANFVQKEFHPPQSHIHQQPSNPMQDFYRECWLPQNLAPPPPPPPPPPPVPPTNKPLRNGHVVNQCNDCSNSNRTSTPVMINQETASRQNFVNTQQTKNSSIIGMNNDGLVKKINIVAMPVKNGSIRNETIQVEQIKTPQIMSPIEHSEVVATKTEMLKELDKLSFVDENIDEFCPASVINENKKENTVEVAIMSKKPGGFETLKLTLNQKVNPIQTKQAQGYSPPILPIPTYQKVLNRGTSNLQTQNAAPPITLRPGDPRTNFRNECKPMRKRDFIKCCKRKLNNTWNIDEDNRRKEDAKKISLEEYKKRIFKNDCKSQHYKKMCKEKCDNSGRRPNVEFKCRKNVDYSTETDLGYDSDSTVVL